MVMATTTLKKSTPLLTNLRQITTAVAGSVAIALSLWSSPAVAGDPFRPDNPHAIGQQTETAFKTIFEQGNYREARRLLETTEDNEPLAHAMKASLDYLSQDWDAMAESAVRTRETAEQLVATDPLRGNLYLAAGHFLEGAHIASTQGLLAATPTVLGKLQQVFSHLDEAEKIAPTDPELNLIKGYMDLMLAVNLPFSDPNQAIERLQNYAAPTYLAQRGIAIGYRDLDQEEQALTAVDRAIGETPDNPDLYYLKAQILVRQGNDRASLEFFEQALAKRRQLPPALANQLAWEHCRASSRVNNTPRQRCDRFLRRS
jgi:tetratricopeptide (TPR) repeat protein